jgi:hypothetical protein
VRNRSKYATYTRAKSADSNTPDAGVVHTRHPCERPAHWDGSLFTEVATHGLASGPRSDTFSNAEMYTCVPTEKWFLAELPCGSWCEG